jgi:hypothetical protein
MMSESGIDPLILPIRGLTIDDLPRQFVFLYPNAVALAPEPSGMPGCRRQVLEAHLKFIKTTIAAWPVN